MRWEARPGSNRDRRSRRCALVNLRQAQGACLCAGLRSALAWLPSMHPCSPGSLMMSKVVQATWQASGLPANVDPWSPGFMTAATFSRISTHPMGRPPAGVWWW
jgi:hypothetical protein